MVSLSPREGWPSISMNRHDIGSIRFLFRANIVHLGCSGLAFGAALLLIALPRQGIKLGVETSDLAHVAWPWVAAARVRA